MNGAEPGSPSPRGSGEAANPPGGLELLRRWQGGDTSAVAALVETYQEWVRAQVRARMGSRLRRKEQSMDVVQESMLEFLRYGPRVRVESEQHFRALLVRIIENVMRDESDFYRARRRAMSREEPLPSRSSGLDASGGITRADEAAERNETQEQIRLALELMDPSDRKVILLRQWDGLEFEQVGTQLGVGADTARMRFNRALQKLQKKVEAMRTGRLETLLAED